jgi:uncharacterized protein
MSPTNANRPSTNSFIRGFSCSSFRSVRQVVMHFIPFLFVLASIGDACAQTSLQGKWEGAIVLPGMNLTIKVIFEKQGDSLTAKIDIPQQGAMGLSLKAVSFVQPAVHFELPAGPGLATFQGNATGDSIKGDFQQAGFKSTFFLAKVSNPPSPEVEEALPYLEEEVKFHNGDLSLAGTLTIPKTGGPFPAMVLITGSGPQNRDEELFGFKPFRVIADHLTRKGIAVLRYDDRGVGGSSAGPATATTTDFAKDALSGVDFLLHRNEINGKEIGLLGHSEGAVAAAIAASQSTDIAFAVLMAGSAVNGEKIVLYQLESIARAGGKSEAEIQQALALQREVFRAVHTGEGWDQVKTKLEAEAHRQIDAAPAEQRGTINRDSLATVLVGRQLRGVQSPWFKFFAAFDPVTALEKVKCPVLALFGERDVQVPVAINRKPMEQALQVGGNTHVAIAVFPEANHLFIASTTGQPSEYPTLRKEFVPGFLDTLGGWLARHLSASREPR